MTQVTNMARTIVELEAEVARLREREAQHVSHYQEQAQAEHDRAVAAEAREAQLKEYADENFTALMDEREKAIAAEARVAELKRQFGGAKKIAEARLLRAEAAEAREQGERTRVEFLEAALATSEARVAELEAELQLIFAQTTLSGATSIARRALEPRKIVVEIVEP